MAFIVCLTTGVQHIVYCLLSINDHMLPQLSGQGFWTEQSPTHISC